MTQRRPNIIQIEFQIAPFESFEALQAECLERLVEGGRSKTVVRFFDLDGSITRLVRRLSNLSQARERNLELFHNERGLMRAYRNWQSKKLAGKELDFTAHACCIAQKRLRIAFEAGERVLIEPGSLSSFRSVRRDEEHELLETISRPEGAWFYVFPFGELGADSPGQIIVSYM